MMQRNRFLDIAKGISMIMVVITHFAWTTQNRLQYGFYFWISMAVPIFMLVTGYLNASSFQKKEMTLKDAYAPKLLWSKLVRFSIPFLYMYAAELVILAIKGKIYNPLQIIFHFFTGGMGVYGTYYFPVLLQLIFILPLIYYTVSKSKYGILICFGVNLLYEILKNVFGMNPELYRLLAFRYIFAVSMGMHIYIHKEQIQNIKWLFMFIAGALYIYIVGYTDYERVIFTMWHTTSMITILYIAPLFLAGLTYLKNVKCTLLENIGKASYHIFLFQIIYYNYIAPYIYGLCGKNFVALFIGIFISLAGGYAYYVLYGYISKKVNRN